MIQMSGYDRAFEVPRTLRHAAAQADVNHPVVRRMAQGRVTTWDLLDPIIASIPGAARWCDKSVQATIAAAAAPGKEAMGCTDCKDTGFYGVAASGNQDMLVTLVKREGEGYYEYLTAAGLWQPYSVTSARLEILDLELAADLASAITAGACGLVRRFCWPIAFLPPNSITAALPGMPEDDAALTEPDAPETWTNFAIVDELDTGAVLNIIRLKPGPVMERYDKGGKWVEDPDVLAKLQGVDPPPLVELTEEELGGVLSQVDSAPADGAPVPADDAPAETAGGALLADAPLTVSPNPKAEKLRRYWSSGEGAAKIRWGTPGDWKRCVSHLSKYMGLRSKGYCQNLHKRNTGVWTGSKLNASAAPQSLEEALVASLNAGLWAGSNGRAVTMAGIKDGIYEEATDASFVVTRTLTAGGFPVAPPSEWFQDPGLSEVTPLTVEDNGRVYGHLASFDTAHIGLPGSVRAPKSRSNYAYFKTGVLACADGKKIPVGQLTLAGGHAPLNADAGTAVAHYDNTASAVTDVAVGEDRFGIWFAGALRPDVTPTQVRTFMASALSGDWRPINGGLELVAACSVNVPGFPIARARVAGGAVMALTAAGARSIAVKKASLIADAALIERVAALESQVAPPVVDIDAATEITVPDDARELTDEPEVDPVQDKIARARQLVKEKKLEALRKRVHGGSADPKA